MTIADKIRNRIDHHGWGLLRLCKEYGLSVQQVKRLCAKHGIELDKRSAARMNVGRFVASARTGRYTPGDLAGMYMISTERVLQLCGEHDISLPLDPVFDPIEYREPDPPLPAQATACLPGPQKVAVLRERMERGESLWHPQDADYAGCRGLAG